MKKTTKKAAKKTAKKAPTKAQFRKMWIEALRSGKYKQTQGALKDEDGYCCLGVACALYNKTHAKKLSTCKNGLGHVYFDEAKAYLPEAVRKKLGIVDFCGSFYDPALGSVTSLVKLNDNGMSFERIANTIERCKDTLFE